MKVTVAICTWNRAHQLDQTLAEMGELRIPAGVDWELLVVNNNSTDDTEAVLAKYADRLPLRRLFERRQGHSNARNCAIEAARGELLIWTDDDVLVDANWVAAYVEAAERWPDAGFFAGLILPWFESTPSDWLTANQALLSGMLVVRDLGPVERTLQFGEWPYGANMAFRRDAFAKLAFDPKLGLSRDNAIRFDETAYCRSLIEMGFKGVWVPGAKLDHLVSTSRMTTTNVWKHYEGHGRSLQRYALATADNGVSRVPRWMYRQYLEKLIRSYWQWGTGNPAWLASYMSAAEAHGTILETRAQCRLKSGRTTVPKEVSTAADLRGPAVAGLVSAIIPTYNRSAYTAEAVESVLAQSYSAVEVIVVDDGSTDDTIARMAEFGERIRYIGQENGGPSKARNRGIREAQGEFIAFLDADDRWLREKLTIQVAYMLGHPEVGLVHGDILLEDMATGEVLRPECPSRATFVGDCYPLIYWGHSVVPSTSLIRRKCLDEVGLFDESIPGPSYEDQDLWMRIARRFHFGYIAECLAIYRLHPGNNSKNQRRNLEDQYRVLVKNLRNDPALWTLLDRRQARQKLRDLAFYAAEACLIDGDDARARYFCWRALAHGEISFRLASRWGFCMLPRSLRDWYRRMRSSKSGRLRAASAVGEGALVPADVRS